MEWNVCLVKRLEYYQAQLITKKYKCFLICTEFSVLNFFRIFRNPRESREWKYNEEIYEISKDDGEQRYISYRIPLVFAGFIHLIFIAECFISIF